MLCSPDELDYTKLDKMDDIATTSVKKRKKAHSKSLLGVAASKVLISRFR